jgi:zinc protease
LFKGHPYGNPPTGRKSDIQKLTRSQILAQYNRLIRGDLLLVIGTGDVPTDRIQSWASDLVKIRQAALTRLAHELQLKTDSREDAVNPVSLVETPQFVNHRRLLIIDKPDRTQTQIHIGQIGVLMTDPDFFPLYLGNYAFGGASFSAILMSEIRVKRGWSYGANSGFRFGLRPRSWTTHLFPAERDTAQALELSLHLIQQPKSDGISQSQFEFAQRSLVNSSGFAYNTTKKRVENTVLEKTLGLPSGFIKSYGEALKKVKFDQVNHALAKFLQPEHLAISVLCTSKKLADHLPAASGVALDEVEVVDYSRE